MERVSAGFVSDTKEVLTVKASVLYKWLTYSAIVISVLLCLFMLQAGLKGNFRSVDTFQSYIRSFGIFAPFIFVFIQAFQVVIPVLPGFIGCVAGALLFGSVGGFMYNYVGICSGSIIAFFLAKHYGIPLVQVIFPSKKYNVWTERIRKAKSYDVLFGLSILLPLAPDDYLCYFSGLINMSVKKFILIILLAKPCCILFYSFGTRRIIH